MRRLSLLAFTACLLGYSATTLAQPSPPVTIAGHPARFDDRGQLLPWINWTAALEREMRFYQTCPSDHGFPRFASVTFMDGDWKPGPRTDTIPATQDGMGILSYLKYFEWRGAKDAVYLRTAQAMGAYLIQEALTPDRGSYPHFPRSTGKRDHFPQPPDAGSQNDHPYEIEPDKGGIAGYALMRLCEATHAAQYRVQALHIARVLVRNQGKGDASHSPWPFRADYRTGQARGPVSGNMTYILRLYDVLLQEGYTEFGPPRQALWEWIRRFQIPSAASSGDLFAQFFEDHDTPTNRTAWAPLNLARYLLEKQQDLGPEWLDHARTLIEFVQHNFTHQEFGVTVCHEQDEDKDAWGGVNSTYGAVLALYAKARDSAELANAARQTLNFTLYCIDTQGRPRDLFKNSDLGGWQEDAHTDVIHNYVDALQAFPAWGDQDIPPAALKGDTMLSLIIYAVAIGYAGFAIHLMMRPQLEVSPTHEVRAGRLKALSAAFGLAGVCIASICWFQLSDERHGGMTPWYIIMAWVLVPVLLMAALQQPKQS